MQMPLPKLEDFLKDPKHEETRAWFDGLVNDSVDRRVAKIKEKKKTDPDYDNPFDVLFGPKE